MHPTERNNCPAASDRPFLWYRIEMMSSFLSNLMFKPILSALALSGCLLASVPSTLAQSGSGLTLWSGVRREYILQYHTDFGGRPNQWDRYKLRIPANKMKQGAYKFIITYPDYYDGKFDTDKIQVNYGDKYKKSATIAQVDWDQDNYRLSIDLEEAIEPDTKVQLKLSNVKNPDFGGTYYFHCQVLTSKGRPEPSYLGTWILSINR